MPIKLGVQTTIGNQLLMVAILGNLATVEYQNTVGLFHGRQPVRNDQRGAVAQEPRQCLVQVVFGG